MIRYGSIPTEIDSVLSFVAAIMNPATDQSAVPMKSASILFCLQIRLLMSAHVWVEEFSVSVKSEIIEFI